MNQFSRNTLIAAVLLCFLLGEVPAKAQQYLFESYSIDDGLAQSQPRSILQDRGGYLWIGTTGGGLSRFDGRTFTNFSTADGLASGQIFALAQDRKGTIWVATSKGVDRFNGKIFQPVPLGIDRGKVFAALEDRKGALWFGTDQSGLVRFENGLPTTFDSRAGLADNTVRALFQDEQGTLWVGTDAGICQTELDVIHFTCFTTADGLSDDAIRVILHAQNGGMWIGTEHGLTLFRDGYFSIPPFESLRQERVSAIAIEHTGSMWVGTGRALYELSGNKLTSFAGKNGIEQGIMALLVDEEDNLWIGTDGTGLYKFSHSPFVLYDTRHGLSDRLVWSILEDPSGSIWFGTSGAGLSIYDGQSFTNLTRKDGLAGNTVYSSLIDHNGDLWFGTTEGVSRYDGRKFTTLKGPGLDGAIWVIYEDKEGALWFATPRNGLIKYKNGTFRKFSRDDGLPSESVYAITADDQGTLWIGTEQGPMRFDGDSFKLIPGGQEDASYLLSDGSNGMWIGTYGGGLGHYTPDGPDGQYRIQTYSTADGLGDDHIMSMTFGGNDDLWLCTNKGLDRVDMKRYRLEGGFAVSHFGVGDGFVGRECNAGAVRRDRLGRLWFGTVKGVMRYTAGEAIANRFPPHIHITDVRLAFEHTDWSPYSDGLEANSGLPIKLRLPYDKNHLTFDFTGISLRAPGQVRYQYRMEGLDAAWTPASAETYATYANLSPGHYSFMVRAENGDGLWNTVPATISFVIRPPFWRTLWFLSLSILVFIAGIVMVIRKRERALLQRQQLLENRVEERTEELRQEKEKVEEANQALEQLSLVARETDNAVVITNADGRIEWINEGVERLTGYTLDEIRRTRGEMLQDVSYNPEIAALIKTAREEKHSVTYEARVLARDGKDRWVSSTLTPIVNDEGQVRKMVIIDSDITERKAMERELINAREAALGAAQAKSEFLANMSHEIRTPMNGVIGMTSLLLDSDLSPEHQEFVEVIRSSGEALLAIINDILDFSKIEAGKIDLEEQAFEVNEVVEEAFDLVMTRAADKGLDLAYYINEEAPTTVRGDVTRVRQILTNLLGNAVKFTNEGQVTVSVDATPLQDRLFELHFHVRDSGIGIPKDRLDRLFQSFSQVDASTTRRFGGTGLGLAISKRLAEMMGGRIWVESSEGVGSVFHFTIRVPSAPTQVRVKYPLGDLRGKRVLVVDDNETNRRMLSLQFERWGIDVTLARSGSEALATLEGPETFDLAVLDMHMPDMDGLMLANEINSRPEFKDFPMVMLSSVGQRQKLSDTPLAAWLTKPAKQRYLFDTLISILGTKSNGATPGSTHPVPMIDVPPEPSLRILLAEDNVVNQKVIIRLLDRIGYRADAVANGLEVISALSRSQYDIVLMDVQMPEMDGYEATRKVRETIPSDCQPYIVAITANATDQDRQECLDAGMDAYLSKPVRVEQLAEVIQTYVFKINGHPAHTSNGSTRTRHMSEKVIPDEPVLSLDMLRESVGDDPEFIREVLASFASDSPLLMKSLRTGIAEGDSQAVQNAAHTLKSTSRLFGAKALADVCQTIERLGREKRLQDAIALMKTAELEFERVKESVQASLPPIAE